MAEAKIDYTKLKSNGDIEKLFSAWDGSLPSFVDYIEEDIKDPDSFEHVETTFRDDGNGITVRMKYRGKNNFNDTITQIATGKLITKGIFFI